MRATLSNWRSPAFSRRWFAAAIAIGVALSAAATAQELPPDHAQRMQRGLKLFETSVAAILKENCVICHGGDETEAERRYRRSREAEKQAPR